MNRLKIIFFICLGFILFCGSIMYLFEPVTSTNFDEINQNAMSQRDPGLCEQIPVEYTYCVVRGTEGKGPEIKTGCWAFSAIKMGSEPRAACLNQYKKIIPDPKVCEVFAKFDAYQAESCFNYIAEVTTNPSLCDNLKENDYKRRCKAIVNLDISYCYTLTSENSRVIDAYCVREVVLRTHDYKSCLLIEGLGRNRCLINAETYRFPNRNPQRKYCEYMIPDPEDPMVRYGGDDRTRCFNNEPAPVYFDDFIPIRK